MLAETFPMWKGETDEQYAARIERLSRCPESYVVLIHDRTFTPGMRGVEVIQPKKKNAFTCGAVEPSEVLKKIARGLQELVNMGGPMPTADNIYIENFAGPIEHLNSENEEIFSSIKPKEEIPDLKPSVAVTSTTVTLEATVVVDRMLKRNAEEAVARAEKELLEKREFDAKAKAKQGLEKWF